MRGSLLAVLGIAVIAGLGSVVAVRNLGLLNQPQVATPTPEQPKAAPPAEVIPQVIVPTRHLFQGDIISGGTDVRSRPMTEEERALFKEKKLDAVQVAESVFLRAPAKDLVADKPILKSDLQEPKKPEALHSRLMPGTRAVDLYVPKENCAGGLIQVGDWVDVYINTDVSRTDAPTRIPYTGVLLQRAPVIAKRDTLYQIYAPLPPNEPIPFTLAANPYRAALIEYARNLGTITLVPVSQSEKTKLDAFREAGKDSNDPRFAIPFAEKDSAEFQTEMEKITRYARGELSIGLQDMVEVLKLPEIPGANRPIETPKPAPKPVTIELLSGVKRTGTVSFAPPPQSLPLPPPGQYILTHPKNGTKDDKSAGAGATGPKAGQLTPPMRN